MDTLLDINGQPIREGDRVVFTLDRTTDIYVGVISEITKTYIVVRRSSYPVKKQFRHSSSTKKLALIE